MSAWISAWVRPDCICGPRQLSPGRTRPTSYSHRSAARRSRFIKPLIVGTGRLTPLIYRRNLESLYVPAKCVHTLTENAALQPHDYSTIEDVRFGPASPIEYRCIQIVDFYAGPSLIRISRTRLLVVGNTHASNVIPVVRSRSLASATVTQLFVPLNKTALPYLPAGVHVALETVPVWPLPVASAVTSLPLH